MNRAGPHIVKAALYLLLFVACVLAEGDNFFSPVIGILSQPKHHRHLHDVVLSSAEASGAHDYYYIAASYVKWLEAAGARSIPIPYDASDDLVDEIFGQINGVLFPGGGCALPASARRVWELALDANANGDFFPIWGTCLGFEFMLMLASEAGETVLQSGFDAENISLPLLFTDSSFPQYVTTNPHGSSRTGSKLFADSEIRRIVSEKNVTMNNHMHGIEPSAFDSDVGLASMFHVTTTNVDRAGRPFVSTIEPLDPDRYPFYGTQYHPEKNNFEYATYPNSDIPYESIDHSPEGIKFSLYVAEFFVSEARKNDNGNLHQYTNPTRHPPVYSYTQHVGLAFEQIYLIPNAKQWSDSSIEQKHPLGPSQEGVPAVSH